MRSLFILLAVTASVSAHAALPAGLSDAIAAMGVDIVSAVGLVLAAGCAVWLIRRMWRDFERTLK